MSSHRGAQPNRTPRRHLRTTEAVRPHTIQRSSTASVSHHPRALSEHVRRTLEGEEQSVDASADVMTCVLGMLQKGWSPGDILYQAFVERDPGFRHLHDPRRGGQGRAKRKLRAEIQRAREFIARSPASSDALSAQTTLAEIADAITAHPSLFKGKAGTTDRAVLFNLIEVARKAKNLQISASGYRIAELAGIRADTAARALKRLCREGVFLRRVTASVGPKPATYRLTLPRGLGDSDIDLDDDPESVSRQVATFAVVHDAFASPNLGLGPALTLATLHTATALTPSEIALRTHRNRSTVVRHLARLAAAGLAHRVAHGYVADAEPSLDPCVLRPVRAPRRALHERRREVFHAWLQSGTDARMRSAWAQRQRRRERRGGGYPQAA